MNDIERIFTESIDMKQFANSYFKYIFKLLNEIDTTSIEKFVEEMEKARKEQKTIFIIGNGGSSATASHMANDFGVDVLKRGGSDLPFRALALTDNTSVMLAIANDDGYDRLFVDQLRTHYRPGDKLVAISASGNSPNVIAAAEWVKKQGGVVMSLVGFDGGRLKGISDIVIHVKSKKDEYGPVEDIHMIMNHLISNWLKYRLQYEVTK
jgi:D-sedoheptulose 7-phosphate isomerase